MVFFFLQRGDEPFRGFLSPLFAGGGGGSTSWKPSRLRARSHETMAGKRGRRLGRRGGRRLLLGERGRLLSAAVGVVAKRGRGVIVMVVMMMVMMVFATRRGSRGCRRRGGRGASGRGVCLTFTTTTGAPAAASITTTTTSATVAVGSQRQDVVVEIGEVVFTFFEVFTVQTGARGADLREEEEVQSGNGPSGINVSRDQVKQ